MLIQETLTYVQKLQLSQKRNMQGDVRICHIGDLKNNMILKTVHHPEKTSTSDKQKLYQANPKIAKMQHFSHHYTEKEVTYNS